MTRVERILCMSLESDLAKPIQKSRLGKVQAKPNELSLLGMEGPVSTQCLRQNKAQVAPILHILRQSDLKECTLQISPLLEAAECIL